MICRWIHLCLFIVFSATYSLSLDFPLIGVNGERIYTYGRLNKLTLSKDANLLATSNTIGSFVWDLRINEDFPIRWLKSKDENHSISAFSPNGEFLFTGNARKQVEIWDISNGERISVLAEFSDSIGWIDVSYDNQMVLVAAGSKITIWNWRDSVIVQEIPLNTSSFGTVYFSPDGMQIISILNRSGDRNDTVAIWDWKSGQIIHQFPVMNNIYYKNFSPDGKWVVLSGNVGEVVLYDNNSYEKYHSFNSTSGSTGSSSVSSHYQISNDGQYLYTINIDDSINKWDIQSKSLIQSFRSHLPSIANQIVLLPAKDSILVNSRSENIKIIDENQDSILGTIGDFPFRIFGANITPDQKLIFDYDPINQVNVRDVITGRKVYQFTTQFDLDSSSYEEIQFSNDSKIFLLSVRQYVAVIDIVNRSIIYEIKTERVITDVNLSQNRNLIVYSESNESRNSPENYIKVIDINEQQEIFQINTNNITVRNVDFLPNNKNIIFGGNESDIRIWNIETDEEVQVIPGHNTGTSVGIRNLNLTFDGTKLFTFDGLTAKLFNIEDGNVIDQFQVESTRFLGFFATSNNGRYTIYNNYIDSNYSLFMRDHKLSVTIQLFQINGELSSLRFSYDGLSAISASPSDATTRLWDLSAFIDEPSSIHQFEKY